MPDYVVQRTALALNERGKAVKGAKVLVLGLAYKPDVDDVRESPSFELIEKLEHLGIADRLPLPFDLLPQERPIALFAFSAPEPFQFLESATQVLPLVGQAMLNKQ